MISLLQLDRVMEPTSVDLDSFEPISRPRCFTWPPQPPSVPPLPVSSNSDEDLARKRKRTRKRTGDTASSKKPNPWGDQSYSDLIAKALSCSPNGRLKLNEIYQWFVDTIPYFNEKSSQEDAAGWKNSIRHNLSLHDRFIRIQNEGTGKSSWWLINPDAKPGRNPRRQRERAHTLESSSKTLEKKRGRVKKRVTDLRSGQTQKQVDNHLKWSPVDVPTLQTLSSSQTLSSRELFTHVDDELSSPFRSIFVSNIIIAFVLFSSRTQSTLSVPPSPSSLEQVHAQLDEFGEFSWANSRRTNLQMPLIPNDILTRTDRICIEGSSNEGQHQQLPTAASLGFPRLNELLNEHTVNGADGTDRSGNSVIQTSPVKLEPSLPHAANPIAKKSFRPPPAYQEIGRQQMVIQQHNQLRMHLHQHHQHQHQHQLQLQLQPPQQLFATPLKGGLCGPLPLLWPPMVNCNQLQQQTSNVTGSFPTDLDNLALEQPGFDLPDVDAMLQHELATAGGKIDFSDFAPNL